AQAIGSYLIGCGVRRKSPVVVFIDRTVKNVVSYMGIVYAGCFYVPIDAAFPEERIKTILSTVEPAYIIADEASGKTQYIHNGNVSLCGNYRNTSEPHPVRFVDKSS
ncbi:MAG: AMP-binding protein, partial [Clostridia bacterium]|nr:AMP-binding protein [Clostridia bacterium]